MAADTAHTERREFEFSDRDFERVRRLIHSRAGIALNSTKKNMVYSRLARRLRSRNLTSFGAYLDQLERGPAEEWEGFVNALTTNLTAFFRETHHFEMLGALVKRVPGERPILLWSAAASTGEEPYSMAIAAIEALHCRRPALRILATDIDTQVLETARRGAYPEAALAGLEPGIVRRYFQQGGGLARVREEVRERVEFRQLNLLESAWPALGPCDAIFCRNVMIYFDRPTQRALLARFAPRLAPHGLLFVGHSESLHWARDLFEPAGHTAYRPARER